MGLARDRNVDWPGDAPEGGARLSTTMDGPEPNALEFDGPWAFFRLLDQAAVEVRSDSESIVRWTLERPGSYSIEVPYEFRAAQNVNPLRPGFFEFACPRQIGPSPTGAGTP
jgi:type VI secretion system protein ImpL